MYLVNILADSKDPRGNRLTTFELVFPRIILSQFSKHRMFSFNTSSSRAVPFEKMVEVIKGNPFIPIAWQSKHSGMQGTEYLDGESEQKLLVNKWLEARDLAVQQSKLLNNSNVTKQLCNRLLEPFMWHTVLLTATEFENFFELRCPKYEYYDMLTGNQQFFKSKKDWLQYYNNKPLPKAKHISKIPENDIEWLQINKGQAEIHMQALAEAMWDAYNESTPEELEEGEWHVPFKNIPFVGHLVDTIDVNNTYWKDYDTQNKVKMSSALAARVSYTTIGSDLDIDYEKLLKLHDRLVMDRHLSCFEHCARVMSEDEYYQFVKGKVAHISGDEYDGHSYDYFEIDKNNPEEEKVYGHCNNLRGFIPYRYMIENGGKI